MIGYWGRRPGGPRTWTIFGRIWSLFQLCFYCTENRGLYDGRDTPGGAVRKGNVADLIWVAPTSGTWEG